MARWVSQTSFLSKIWLLTFLSLWLCELENMSQAFLKVKQPESKWIRPQISWFQVCCCSYSTRLGLAAPPVLPLIIPWQGQKHLKLLPRVWKENYSLHEQWSESLHSCSLLQKTRVLQNYFSKCLFCKNQKQIYLPCFIKRLLYVCLIFGSTSFTQAKSKGKAGQWAGRTRINCRSSIYNGRNVSTTVAGTKKLHYWGRGWVSFATPAECPRAPLLRGCSPSAPPSPFSRTHILRLHFTGKHLAASFLFAPSIGAFTAPQPTSAPWVDLCDIPNYYKEGCQPHSGTQCARHYTPAQALQPMPQVIL